MKQFFAMLLILAITGYAAPAAAQQNPPPDAPSKASAPEARAEKGRAARAAKDAEIRELIETIRMAKLSKELGLTDEQSVLFVRRFQEYRRLQATLRKERARLIKHLKESIQANASDADIEEQLNRLIQHDEKMARARCSVYKESYGDLTPQQRAKLYVFSAEFDADMQRLIERARRYGRDGAQGQNGRNNYSRRRWAPDSHPGFAPGTPPPNGPPPPHHPGRRPDFQQPPPPPPRR